MRHKKYTYSYDSPSFNKIKGMNCELLKLFFKNNSYKLKKHNISLYKQIGDLCNSELKVDYANIWRMKAGKEFSCSLTYLNIFCLYWDCTLLEMINYDHEDYDKRMSEGG